MFDIPIRHFWKKNGDPHTSFPSKTSVKFQHQVFPIFPNDLQITHEPTIRSDG